jgi:cyclohexyl-isocyanide hydratase
MKIACFLYHRFTAIDMLGPITAWNFVPGVQFEVVAAKKGLVETDTGLAFNATHDFSDFSPNPDVVFAPGGAMPTFDAMLDEPLLEAVARAGANAKWVTSVCTGSLVLAAAGLLEGYRSACHWFARPYLEMFGAIPDASRVVIDRNRASGGGMTAGIDFGLHMLGQWCGEAKGRSTELILEYAPEPPFGTGRPDLPGADTTLVDAVSKGIATVMPFAVAERAAARMNARRKAA